MFSPFVRWALLHTKTLSGYRQTGHRQCIPRHNQWKHFDPTLIHLNLTIRWTHSTNESSIDRMTKGMHVYRQNDVSCGVAAVAVVVSDDSPIAVDCTDLGFAIDSEIHRMLSCHYYPYFPMRWIVCIPIFSIHITFSERSNEYPSNVCS